MRILVAIPHYFGAVTRPEHGSQENDSSRRRRALTACIAALHQVFGRSQVIGLREQPTSPAGEMLTHEIEIVICTTKGRHLLEDLPVAPGCFSHNPTQVEPMLLGFECQAVLGDALGRYDYYCYLEDDLVIHDPMFFVKIGWFTRATGKDAVLQPNRYEVATAPEISKAYIDGSIIESYTAPFQDVSDRPWFRGTALGLPVEFRRALNPHSGCFFLDADQMADWASRPWFLDRDTRFVGPLESAATLGLMRTFRVYKPAPPVAGFLEIQHFGTGHLDAMKRFAQRSDAEGRTELSS